MEGQGVCANAKYPRNKKVTKAISAVSKTAYNY
jgi:hypothetical protein